MCFIFFQLTLDFAEKFVIHNKKKLQAITIKFEGHLKNQFKFNFAFDLITIQTNFLFNP